MKLTSKIFILLSCFFFTFSCKEEDLDKTNPNQLTSTSYFKNTSEITKGVNSIYALIQGNGLVGREYFFLHDLRSDDAASGGGQLETPRNQVLSGALNPANAVVGQVWNGLYHAIFRANVVIENSAALTEPPTELSKRLVGEARFLRAWCYMELVTLWGGVPVYSTVPKSLTESAPRSTEAGVYALIIADLKAAQMDLPLKYTGAELGRATKGAAQMLLARAYLNQNDYASAKTELQSMITSGVYKLRDNYYDNFSEETEWNDESVFEIGFGSEGDVNWMGDGDDPNWGAQEKSTRAQEYSPVGWRNVIPSNSLIAEFESTAKGDAKTDPRRSFSFITLGETYGGGGFTLKDAQVQGNTSVIDGVTTKVSWLKYTLLYKEDPGGYKTSGINQRIMRYADALLMMAECENEVGTPVAAISYLNQVRTRPSVAMPPYPTSQYLVANKPQIFEAIVHERRVELGGEQVRNRDILRWRKNNKITIDPISGFKPLLPIPQDEIDNNDKIEQKDQNPGY